METFADFITQIEEPKHRERTKEVLDWVTQKYPQMQHKIGWNQPMFTDHGTFIIGFSVSKNTWQYHRSRPASLISAMKSSRLAMSTAII